MRLAPLTWALPIVCGCGRAQPEKATTAEGGAVAAASITATVTSAAATVPARTMRWHGSYRSEVGTLYVPPGWKNLQWKGTDTPAGVGTGTMTVTVDAASGRVSGAVDGPLGPATVEGLSADGKLTASIRRRDPSDHGFSGTIAGVMAGAHAEGTMNVSLAEASAIRTAAFELSPDGTERKAAP